MRIQLLGREIDFRPWKPADGKVFPGAFASDCETCLIDQERHWVVPPYVLGAAADGTKGVFITRQHLQAFFECHGDNVVIFHNATFDLRVIHQCAPALNIYDRVDRHQIQDTRLLHRLYRLASAGDTASGKGQSSLEHCAEKYLGLTLPKDVQDSQGRPVRTSYGQWLGRLPADIPPVYLEYLAKDVLATFALHGELVARLNDVIRNQGEVFGYVSDSWLQEQWERWGVQTHDIQLQAEIVLADITANGLYLDGNRRDELAAGLEVLETELRDQLRQFGYLPGQGSSCTLQKKLKQLEKKLGVPLSRTATGQYSTKREDLEELTTQDPFLKIYLEQKTVEKLRSTYLGKMNRNCVHASFNVLARTGRTTLFGEMNAQNLPRDDRVRSCFTASPGNILIAADYTAIEMVTQGQAFLSQFELESRLAEIINRGDDPHRLVAAKVTGKHPDQVTRDERQAAKAINFGKPGGMGPETLRKYARQNYGLELSLAQVDELTTAWLNLFPEMEAFLNGFDEWGDSVAEYFQQTPSGFAQATGRDWVLNIAQPGTEDRPLPLLGAMCLKVLRDQQPETQDQRPYSEEEQAYFWEQVQQRFNELPDAVREAIQTWSPSPQLAEAVQKWTDRKGVFTLTGRLRANAGYTARHNTIFQGLAADGAKLTLWKLWRAGYRIVNFIHDEVLIEVPEGDNLAFHAERIKELMIAGMREVVPDIRIGVEYAAMRNWSKDAEPRYTSCGDLIPWEPEVEQPVA